MNSPSTLVIRDPEDLLALVPCVLGFHPEESLVVVTFGPGPSFHARVDLPRTAQQRSAVIVELAPAMACNRVEAVIAVLYSDDPERARLMLAQLADELLEIEVRLLTALRVAGGHWFQVTAQEASSVGVPFDLTSHPFLVETVFAGRVTHASRAELAASLDPDPRLVADVDEALTELDDASDPEAALDDLDLEGDPPTSRQVAALLGALDDTSTTVRMLGTITRRDARHHVERWRAVLRGAPRHRRAGPLAMVALTAWLDGNGALAWCAFERLEACAPQHPWCDWLRARLVRAVAPGERIPDDLPAARAAG